jgi:NADH-quinone oxidoreductase subunit N
MSYLSLLKLAAPETVLVLTAFGVLGLDVAWMRGLGARARFAVGGLIACAGCVAAGALLWVVSPQGNVAEGMFVADPLIALVKAGVLGLTVFTVGLSVESDFTEHVGEYLALVLLAAAGMLFLVSAEDILMIFVSLELTSLSLYVLTAFNKRNAKSAEAALKYFLFGGMAAAFTLFGLSLLYGLSGATNLGQIAAALAGKGLDPLLVVAMVMVVAGFGFKVAAVPFHLWAPDAYEGAPTPSAAFIASGSKLASFFIFAKVMMIGFAGVEGSGAWRAMVSGWVPAVAVVAALSMVLGNLTAIVQRSVRRLIAYSAIAHAGYLLLAVAAHDREAMAALLYYAITYGLTTLGAFGVVALVEARAGDDRFSSFAGLSRRAPVASAAMLVFMLSLAGIPPLAGFFGKFYVFAAALKTGAPDLGLLWLVALAVATSAVSLYYYLQVLKQIYVVAPADAAAEAVRSDAPPRAMPVTECALAVLALAVVLLGCFPNWLVGWILRALGAASP